MDFNIEGQTILLVRHGSHAYGTNIEGSDVDVKGICVPPVEYHLGCHRAFEQHESKVPNDSVVFSLRKFARLAGDCNPNVIEVLFVDEADVLLQDKWGQELRQHRDLFLSRKAKHTFSGYAHSQLKRIRTHRSWLLKPPQVEPRREDFDLPPTRTISRSEMGAFLEVENRQLVGSVGLQPGLIELLQREKKYGLARREWEQFQEWKRSRNPARAALEAKHGYDTKHAGHLIRLMRMCREILSTGQVIVRRPDADELRSIRAGAWDYDRLIEEAERMDAECAQLELTSALPRSPDWEEIDRLVVRLTMGRLGLVQR